MPLAPRSRLGPYEVGALLGAGGMGEVYRAKDTRLGRDVAVKILPEEFFEDKDRKERFEREARILASLNHPGIAAIHSFEEISGRHLLIMELLEGESLRDRLEEGALPLRKTVEIAVQIANGLAAAHEKGIVHRDLKPENVFVTKEGRVKILDFGLAKLTQPERTGDLTSAPTTPAPTDAGAVMGTAGYMSPEQVRGERVDARSDIFAFGTILYEMLSGNRAFKGASAVETMHAVLKDEPPDLFKSQPGVTGSLDRIVRRCLEKSPDERFQSALDVGFALEATSGTSEGTAIVPALSRFPRWVPATLAAFGVLIGAALGAWSGQRLRAKVPSEFKPLTFRRGTIGSARFEPDGKSVVYSAAWGTEPLETFTVAAGVPESRALGLAGTNVLAVSRSGVIAVQRADADNLTVAEVAIAGGAPRDILENVRALDYAPDGRIAIARAGGQTDRLEFPPGHALYETQGWIDGVRVSPDGTLVAFLQHPQRMDNRGNVMVADAQGKVRGLEERSALIGLAWSADGREVLFSDGSISAVTLAGKVRLVQTSAIGLRLLDVNRAGDVLVAAFSATSGMRTLSPGETQERDLTWLDGSTVADLSADGRTLLFTENGDGAGSPLYGTFLRKTNGQPAVRLGNGWAQALSPDGKWALAIHQQPEPAKLMLLPTGAGEPREIPGGSISHKRAAWFPDGRRIAFSGTEGDRPPRLYVQDAFEGPPKPITEEGVFLSWLPRPVSPDGKWVATIGKGLRLFPVDGGEPRLVPGREPGEMPACWSVDGLSLYLVSHDDVPNKIVRVDVASGRREIVRNLMPPDKSGVTRIFPVAVTPDGRSYAYSYGQRADAGLFLVKGLK